MFVEKGMNSNDSELEDGRSLFNSVEIANAEQCLFEQYKLYVEMTDRISQRRTSANSFFITTNAALITIASWFQDDFGKYLYVVSVIGIVVALFWFYTIRSYGQLNSVKFEVIHTIEKHLPMNLFSYEWKHLGDGKSYKKYWPLSHIERIIPFVFIVLYLALSLFVLLKV